MVAGPEARAQVMPLPVLRLALAAADQAPERQALALPDILLSAIHNDHQPRRAIEWPGNRKALQMTILSYVEGHGPIARGAFGDHVKLAQEALMRAGRDLVPDRDYGGITETAVTKFQLDRGLNAVGYIGPKTAAALDAVPKLDGVSIIVPKPSILKVAPWLSVMRALNGTKEIIGPKNNAIIVGWPKEIAKAYPDLGPDILWYKDDSVAWCGLGAGIAAVRGGEKPPKALLGAGNWASFGQSMKLAQRTPSRPGPKADLPATPKGTVS